MIRRSFAAWSLAALLTGLGAGLVLHGSTSDSVGSLSRGLQVLGRFWVVVLQALVVPLVLSHAAMAVLHTQRLGRIGLKTIGVMLGLFVGMAALMILITPLVLQLYPVEPGSVEQLRASVTMQQAGGAGPELRMFDWVRGYLPENLWGLFRGANLLPVLGVTLVLSLIARAVAGPKRDRLHRGVERAAHLSLRVATSVLRLAPIGVFALAFGLAFGAGIEAVGLLTFYIVSLSILLILFTLMLYPLVRWLGKMPMRRFGYGAAPAQIIAMSTRSSLVSLPAMIEGANDRLHLPPAATGFVLPFTVSTFKLSMAVGHVYMLLLVAHVFGPPLGFGTVVVAAASMMLMSVAVPGIPGGNPGMTTLPVFVAAGLPAQGVLMLDAVDAIPDIFKTTINVTADLATAVIVTGGEPAGSGSPAT